MSPVVEQQELIDIIYLDYAKAFDSVVHTKLLIKLSCHRINDETLDWMCSFLTDRKQNSISPFISFNRNNKITIK